MKGSIYDVVNYSYGFITAEPTHETVFFHKNNNSDYLQKARKYGHFTGYKN